ncbi:hypothetical protein F0562_035323 [Nyssa sinensis]|uniref:TLDc domain-containing protein n=1 Tax=Nyssa sinensis TaxID=561372 RepID=A0A5J5ACH9_9ASTE|nr:hypothetical protein F0562_035323 [Nyssa sinensis]
MTTTMLSWKDKVTDKISRIFSDSPPSSTSPILDQPQARPYSREGKSLSSILSFVLPSADFDRFRSNKYQHDIKPVQSLPVRWNSRSLSWRDKSLDSYVECNPKCEDKETLKSHEKDGENVSGRKKGALNVHEEYRDPGSIRSTSDLYEFLQSALPNIVKGCRWVLLYGTIKHGISLGTLIRKSADLSGPCLLIVGDMQGAVFGGLIECPLKPTKKRKYQGTSQTFVFTTIYGAPRIFRPTGANRYFYMCLNDLLALGGGGNFALCLDGELLTGTSGPCETFGNLCLAHSQEFELKNVELWGFTHSSQYLT